MHNPKKSHAASDSHLILSKLKCLGSIKFGRDFISDIRNITNLTVPFLHIQYVILSYVSGRNQNSVFSNLCLLQGQIQHNALFVEWLQDAQAV